jgi:ankyrin repeat protein
MEMIMTNVFKCTLCVALLCMPLSVCGQYWQNYTNVAVQERKDFTALLEGNPDLKAFYTRYRETAAASKAELDRFIHEDAELRSIEERLIKTQGELEDLQKNKIGGKELERKNDIIEALMRMRQERIAGNAELTRLEETESRLRKEFNSALSSKLGYACNDEDFVCVVRCDQTSYDLEGENPFADMFSDLSKARFQKDVVTDAHSAVTAALCKENPKSSPEAVREIMNSFFKRNFKVPEQFEVGTEKEDLCEEYYRLLCCLTRRMDGAEYKQWQRARDALSRRLPHNSLLRFIFTYQMNGRNNPNAWLHELAQWLVHDQENAGLMKYINEWLSYSHRPASNYDKTDFQLLAEHLSGHAQELKDQWIVHVMLAINELTRAWAGRGSGFSNTVTEKGWDIYGDAMKNCIHHAEAAIKLHPDWAGAYLPLLDDYGGNHLAEFRQLMKYRPDFSEAYQSLIWGLLPRWCGSHALIVALARICMDTKLYDTALPSIGFSILGIVAFDTPCVEWSKCYREKWLYEPALALFDERQTRGFSRDIRLDKALFHMANFEYDAAAAIIKEVQGGDPTKKIVFPSWAGRGVGNWYPKVPVWDDAATRLRLFTGKYASELRALEQLAVIRKDFASASKQLRNLIEAHDDWTAEERDFLVDLYARWQMPQLGGAMYSMDNGHYLNAFVVACGNNFPKVAKAMLELKFDYAKYEEYPGQSAYFLAGRGALPDIMDLLKQAGDPLNRPTADPKMQHNQPIHHAAQTPNPQMVRHLVELGVDANAVNDHGHTIMHFFATKSSIEGLKLGLELGCNPDAQDADGDTAMMFLAQLNANPECMRILAVASKNINTANHAGMTALHYAAQYGDDPEYIKILLAAGADGQARTNGDLTAHDIAKSRSRSELMALLPEPDPNYVPENRVISSSEAPSDWGAVIVEFLKMPVFYAALAGIAIVLVFVLKQKKK